ncbi:copper transporter [Aeromicrobium sp. UC242_57]|uniref:copper transporter n=1 Tax=Aeromicrobium sp. UC242_57 TaxID=3374624 RepID=UPI00378C91EE
MINFRYHLVSIAAILIALAAGIALGSGPLDDASEALGNDKGSSQAADPAVAAFEAGFADRASSGLLKDKLKGQAVLVVTVPGTEEAQVKGITSDLGLAGAEVTGEIALTSKLLDSSGRQFAEGVAEQSAADVPAVTSATGS